MRKEKEKNLLSATAEGSLSSDMRYAQALHRFHRFYWTLVAITGTVCALSVVIAVVANVLVGLCLAVCAAVLYHYLKKRALLRMLGLTCTASEGGLCLQSASAVGEDTLYLPTHLFGLRVRALGQNFLACDGNEALTRICFLGSGEEWERMAIHCDLSAVTVECGVALPDPSALTADASTEDAETEGKA